MVPPLPLFGPIPGGPELLIISLVFLIPLGVGAWVYYDATKHDVQYAPAWALGVTALFLAWIIPGVLGFFVYIYYREKTAHTSPA
jgi:membrane protein YdbS with pleckstrin-like domain